MSYRILMIWALKPSTTGVIYSAEARLIYEPKRSEMITKAYTNCIIPMTHGYTLTCL
jgi:hypothetical protein